MDPVAQPHDRGRGRPPPSWPATAARAAQARPPAAGRLRRLLDQRGDAARARRSGEPPRAMAERLGDAARRAAGRDGRAGRDRGPRVPQPVHGGRLVPRHAGRRCSRRASDYGAGQRRRAREPRVREREPDRADHDRVGAARGLRRLARAHPRARRPRRRARVLRERRRQPGAPLRRVDPGARARRGAARGRLPGRLRDRAGRADRRRGRRRPRRARAAGHRADAGGRARVARRASACTWTASSPSAACTRRARSRRRSSGSDGVYEHDGALWLRTTAHGDDKDRVLRRSNGE